MHSSMQKGIRYANLHYINVRGSMNNLTATQTPHAMIPMTFETKKGQELGRIDVGFLVVCIIFIFLGSCGVLANGRGFCLFFHSSTV